MKEQLKVSIIIPVYNAEKYVAECLNSIRNQSFQDYEVVVVNDGSRDGSLKVCLEIAKMDSRIAVFSTENRGVSQARNYGLKHAKAPWVMFLDSDDYLVEDCLERIVKTIENGDECIYGDYIRGMEDFGDVKTAVMSSEDVLAMTLDAINNDLFPDFYHIKDATFFSACGKLYSRELIEKHQINFDQTLKLSEDMFFNINYLQKIQKVKVANIPVFVYRENEASATNNFREQYIDNRFYLFERLRNCSLDTDVFTMSTILPLICQMEKYTEESRRRVLERRFVEFFETYRKKISIKGKALSTGRCQKYIYKISGMMFLAGLYDWGFAVLRLYVKIAKGKI